MIDTNGVIVRYDLKLYVEPVRDNFFAIQLQCNAEDSDFAYFFEEWTKVKIASEIRPPSNSINSILFLNQVSLLTAVKIAFS